jgi:hypothetical protein
VKSIKGQRNQGCKAKKARNRGEKQRPVSSFLHSKLKTSQE